MAQAGEDSHVLPRDGAGCLGAGASVTGGGASGERGDSCLTSNVFSGQDDTEPFQHTLPNHTYSFCPACVLTARGMHPCVEGAVGVVAQILTPR